MGKSNFGDSDLLETRCTTVYFFTLKLRGMQLKIQEVYMIKIP